MRLSIGLEFKMNMFVIGEGALCIYCVTHLMTCDQEILGIFSDDEKTVEWATKNRIKCWTVDDIESVTGQISFDVLWSIVNPYILSTMVISRPRLYAINYHDSLLPTYAGVNSAVWAILNGEVQHGVTWHTMTAAVDAGEILLQDRVEITNQDSTYSLNMKCIDAGMSSFNVLLCQLLQNELCPKKQDLKKRTFFSSNKPLPNNGVIDWYDSALGISRLVRALNFGGVAGSSQLGLAKFLVRQTYVKCSNVEILDATASATPGQILSLSADHIVVMTHDKPVKLSGLQLDIHGSISALDLARLYTLNEGDCLRGLPNISEAKQINAQVLMSTNISILPKHIDVDVRREMLPNIIEAFDIIVNQYPKSTSVEYRDQIISYEQLFRNSILLAKKLISKGAKQGDVIATLLPSGPEFLGSILAILRCGCVYMPLDVKNDPQYLKKICEKGDAKFVLSSGNALFSLGKNVEYLSLPEFSNWSSVFLDDRLPSLKIPSSSAACLMFSSGSSGEPKGIITPHIAITNSVIDVNYANFRHKIRIAQCANCSFDMSICEVWGALLNGGCLIVINDDNELRPEVVEDSIRNRNIQMMFLSSGRFHAIARYYPAAFSQLEYLLLGGDILDSKVCRAVLNSGPPACMVNGYGPTETTAGSTFHKITMEDVTEDSIPVGIPVSGARIAILDGALQVVPVGVSGELFIGGLGLSLGYLKNDHLTNEKFIEVSLNDERLIMYRTGDQVKINNRGLLEFQGRRDFQVKIRGFRIEIQHVEFVLKQFPFIHDAVVEVIDNANEKELVAFIACDPVIEQQTIMGHLICELPAYAIPSKIISLKELPLNSRGKLDRATLRKSIQVSTTDTALSPDLTEYEIFVISLFQYHTGIQNINLDTEILDLAINSLSGVEILTSIYRMTRQSLPLASLSNAGSVRNFARLLTGERNGEGRYLQILWGGGYKAPLFFFIAPDGKFDLARLVDTSRPMFSLNYEPQNENGGKNRYHTIEEWACLFLKDIRRVQPKGPYLFCGHSVGGLIALEAAVQLEQQGETVGFIGLFDPTLPFCNTVKRQFRWKLLLKEYYRSFWCRIKANMYFAQRKFLPYELRSQYHKSWGIVALYKYTQKSPTKCQVTLFKTQKYKEQEKNRGFHLPENKIIRVLIEQGSHMGQFLQPYVEKTAEHLRKALPDF